MAVDTAAPYGCTLNTLGLAGAHSLAAKAIDSRGLSRWSAVRIVTVTSAVNQLPTVQLTLPGKDISVSQGSQVALTATASDADGRIARVEFYRGSQLIGSDATAPYGLVLNTSGLAGVQAITARAYDDDGASRVSAAQDITVVVPPPTTSVSFSIPQPVIVDMGTNFPVQAPASYLGRPLTAVQLFAVTGTKIRYLDTTSSAPWQVTFHPYTVRTFVLRVRALYGTGDKAVSLWSQDRTVEVRAKPGGNG
jgi:hypothetical protein